MADDDQTCGEALSRLAEAGVRGARIDIEDVLHDIERSLRTGEGVSAGDVWELRDRLNFLVSITEENLAVAAEECEPWERLYDMPASAYRRYPDVEEGDR